MQVPSPTAPFRSWPVHVYAPEFGFVWFFEETMTVVTQSVAPHGTVVVAERYLGLFDAIVARAGGRLAAGEAFSILHDWRSMTDYDTLARQRVADRMRTRPKGYIRKTVLVAAPNTGWRMALSVTDLVFTFLKAPCPSLTADIDRAYSEFAELTVNAAPKRQTWAPGRIAR